MSDVYREQREKVTHNTQNVVDGLKQVDAHFRSAKVVQSSELHRDMLVRAGRSLVQTTDPTHGGIGTKPKFPCSPAHAFLGRASLLPFGDPAKAAYLLATQKMVRGGIYDHLGGGFSRYSVDERWLVPHFEKMLYDNGQLLEVVADAFALTGEQEYCDVVRETTSWLEREMSDAAGGLFASQDADSEGVEGKYYVWTPAQIQEALGQANAMLFCDAYGVTPDGNFEHQTTILSRRGRGSSSDEKALRKMRETLLAARVKRIAPETDTKVLAGWNGLAIVGLLRAWQATGHERARELATRVGEFIVTKMIREDGTYLSRVFKDGAVKLEGTLDDYAFCALAFLNMAECFDEPRWWQRGMKLIDVVIDRFYAEDAGGIFYLTAKDDDPLLMHRPESHHDGAMPAGAAVTVACLLRRALVQEDSRAFAIAENYLAARVSQAVESPVSGARLLSAFDFYLHGAVVVITDGAGANELREVVRKSYQPNTVLAGSWASESLLGGKVNSDNGDAQAYVCQAQSCSEPVSTPEALRSLLCP